MGASCGSERRNAACYLQCMNAPIHYLNERVLLVREETTPSYRLSDWKQVDVRIAELGRECVRRTIVNAQNASA